MQEIHCWHTPVVTGIGDPEKSQASRPFHILAMDFPSIL